MMQPTSLGGNRNSRAGENTPAAGLSDKIIRDVGMKQEVNKMDTEANFQERHTG